MYSVRSIEDLYKKVLPALKAREAILVNQRYVLINYEDIWNYLLQAKWLKTDNIELSEIIDDIMCVDGYNVSKYVKDRISSRNKKEYYYE